MLHNINIIYVLDEMFPGHGIITTNTETESIITKYQSVTLTLVTAKISSK